MFNMCSDPVHKLSAQCVCVILGMICQFQSFIFSVWSLILALHSFLLTWQIDSQFIFIFQVWFSLWIRVRWCCGAVSAVEGFSCIQVLPSVTCLSRKRDVPQFFGSRSADMHQGCGQDFLKSIIISYVLFTSSCCICTTLTSWLFADSSPTISAVSSA